jgi:large subunit ribosomal protein L29
MTGKEVRALSDEELLVETDNLTKRLYDLRAAAVTEKIEDPSQFKKIRRDIARLKGERRARELAALGAGEEATS